MSLADEMKRLSDEITAKSDAEEARKKKKADAEVQRQAAANRKKADAALAQVRDKALAAVQRAERKCIVYTHDADEMGHDGVGMESWPIGAAKLVKDGCKAMGFKTYWGQMSNSKDGKPYYVEISW